MGSTAEDSETSAGNSPLLFNSLTKRRLCQQDKESILSAVGPVNRVQIPAQVNKLVLVKPRKPAGKNRSWSHTRLLKYLLSGATLEVRQASRVSAAGGFFPLRRFSFMLSPPRGGTVCSQPGWRERLHYHWLCEVAKLRRATGPPGGTI